MALDPNIILGGRGVDVMGAMGAGNALATQTNQLQQQNALAQLYKTQGAGIMNGDPNALNALAAIDPAAGQGFQAGALGMDQTRQQMAVLDENTKRAAEEYARGLSAEQKAAEAAQIEAGVKQALMAPTPEAFDAMMIQMGHPDMVGQFENRETLAAQFMSVAEIMKAITPEPVVPLSGPGKVAADINAGILPQGTDLYEPGTSVTVNNGDGPNDAKLRGKLMEKEGELWSTYLETGATSAGTVQDMAALDELIAVAPQGPITGRLAEIFPGFSTAGDAFQSIVKRVAPTLRAPGSGATSDIEYDGMLRSLPALRNTPEANAAIASMMKAKAEINVKRAAVIAAYQNGEIDATQARKDMTELDKISILSPEAAAALGINAPPASGSSPASGNVTPSGVQWSVAE